MLLSKANKLNEVSERLPDWRAVDGVLLLSFIGIFSLWIVTGPWGIGLSPDSASYISAARGILKGQGFVEPPQWNKTLPMYCHGPLFSIMLAGLGIWGVNIIAATRILNIFLFGVNIFLVGWIIFHYTRSRWAALTSSFFILTSLVTLELHAMAWSEALFLFWGFLGLFLLTLFLDGNRNYLLFVASSLALGLAFLTKYSGVSFAMTGVIATLIFDRLPRFQRMANAAVVALLSCLPMTLWVIRAHLVANGEPTELSWYFAPYVLGHVRQLFAYLSMWLLPENAPALLRGLVLLAFLTGLLVVSLKVIRQKEIPTVLPGVLLLIILSHIGTYFFTTAFIGENPFDNRALSPAYVASTIYIAFMVHSLAHLENLSNLFRLSMGVLAILAGSYLWRGFEWGGRAYKEGLAYSHRQWKTSETVERVKQLPSDIPIYSNGGDLLYLLTEKPASGIPGKEEVLRVHIPDQKRRLRKEYPAELVQMRANLKNHDGVVVFLNGIKGRWYLPSEKELSETIPLEAVEKLSDGTIYRIEK